MTETLGEANAKRIEELVQALQQHSHDTATHRSANTEQILMLAQRVQALEKQDGVQVPAEGESCWEEFASGEVDPKQVNFVTELEAAAKNRKGQPHTEDRKTLYKFFRKGVVGIWKQCCTVCQGRGHRDRACPSRKKLLKLQAANPEWASLSKLARISLAQRYSTVLHHGHVKASPQLFGGVK